MTIPRGRGRGRSGPGSGAAARRGAVLGIVVVLMFALAVLATAAFVLFRSNLRSGEWREDRVRAMMAAESGAALAMHYLGTLDVPPSDPEPFSLDGDSLQWIEIPGSGGDKVWVVVDPFDQGMGPVNNGGVEIRSRGMSGESVRDVVVRACPDYPSRYARLVDRSLLSRPFVDGDVVDGPVHCNGPIGFASLSSDSAGDPYLSMVGTTVDGGFHFSGHGYSTSPHPEGSNVWVRPFAHHLQGKPYWDATADSIDFDGLRSYFEDLSGVAASQGSYLSGVRRLLIDGSRIICSAGPESEPETLSLAGRDVVFVRGGPVYVKTIDRLTTPLTLVVSGDLIIAGQLDAPGAGLGTPLGLVSLGDVQVARDPDLWGGTDWAFPWEIETEGHILVHATVAALGGSLRAESPGEPTPQRVLSIHGGLMEREAGRLGTSSGGFGLALGYDSGLQSVHPPRFPSLETWVMTSWMMDPDYGDRSIDDNMF
ncbi:hypothetical protein JW921_07265 [Candidatus Fermentibacterales bacterium]|nr:hypothetical protein [Candidatus Fermentibacterales bacterium]